MKTHKNGGASEDAPPFPFVQKQMICGSCVKENTDIAFGFSCGVRNGARTVRFAKSDCARAVGMV